MVPRLQPGKLAQLITALYTAREQHINGTLGPALRQAAAATGLNVIYSSDQVPPGDNEYNITAAMLAPDVAELQSAACDSNTPMQHHGSTSVASSCSTTVKARTLISSVDPGQTSRNALSTNALQAKLNGATQAVADPARDSSMHLQPPALFPVYVIIAGIDRGLQAHTRANMQILSQADFFWGLDKFWSWVGRRLGHYQTVPDVLLKPQSGMLLPWVRHFHKQHMPGLAEKGYAGVQVVMSGHSLGAAIIDTAALMLPHSCSDLPIMFSSVSFESPGVPQAVLRQYGNDISVPDRMTSYLGNPSPVNSLCKHPGRVYHVYADPSKMAWMDVALYVGVDAARFLTLTQIAAAVLGMPSAGIPLSAALAAGAAASLIDKVALAWQDLVLHHSLSGMSLGFSPVTGQPYPQALQEMLDWPLFSPSLGNKLPVYLFRDLLLGMCAPSVMDSRNRGVQMLIEGSRARHMRLVRQLPGYVAK